MLTSFDLPYSVADLEGAQQACAPINLIDYDFFFIPILYQNA